MNETHLKQKLLELTELRYRHLAQLMEMTRPQQDQIGNIMRCHLFAESLLEELIRIGVGANAEAVLGVRLTFAQKLGIVSGMELSEDWPILPDFIVGSLRRLNALRNSLAHQFRYEISEEDVRDLFLGLEDTLPYGDVLDSGIDIAISRYAAYIYGHMLPKYETE